MATGDKVSLQGRNHFLDTWMSHLRCIRNPSEDWSKGILDAGYHPYKDEHETTVTAIMYQLPTAQD